MMEGFCYVLLDIVCQLFLFRLKGVGLMVLGRLCWCGVGHCLM